jgi:hypothetical protein
MTLSEAVKTIAGRAGFVATRPRGIVITVSDNGRLMKFGSRGPHSWACGLLDMIADDWIVLSPETQQKMAAARAAELAAQQAGNDGGEPQE